MSLHCKRQDDNNDSSSYATCTCVGSTTVSLWCLSFSAGCVAQIPPYCSKTPWRCWSLSPNTPEIQPPTLFWLQHASLISCFDDNDKIEQKQQNISSMRHNLIKHNDGNICKRNHLCFSPVQTLALVRPPSLDFALSLACASFCFQVTWLECCKIN